MLLKLLVVYGLNEARQFIIEFLRFALYGTVAVTKSLMCFVGTYDPVVNLTCKRVFMLISVNFVCFLLVLQLAVCL
jgi:hypothetical protein